MKKFLLRYETVAVTVIALFCIIFLVQTFEYGRRAGLFPRLISWVVLFLILVFIVSRLRRFWKSRGAPSPEETRSECVTKADQPQGMKWTLTFALAMGFCILLYLVGFGPATVCYLSAHIYLAGYRKGRVIIVYALAVGVIMVAFGYLFQIPLPEGILVELIKEYLPEL